jgi:tRNA (cytidine/uridine-2'-O-)-methyltransferase
MAPDFNKDVSEHVEIAAMAMRPDEVDLYPKLADSTAFLPPSSKVTVVLVEPQIPQNTGNIMRLCACTGSRLFVVGNLGFTLDAKGVKRTAMDYDEVVQPEHVYSFDEVLAEHPAGTPVFFMSAKATRSLWDVAFPPACILVFGSETKGLPPHFVERQGDKSLRIPMVQGVRSQNLANSVSIVLYEALRQQTHC